MSKLSPIEVKANQYAAEKLRELRGETARAKFGPLLGSNEGMLYSFEKCQTRLTIGKLAHFARKLNVPLSTFILPDDDDELQDSSAGPDFQTVREKTEA